MARTAGRGLKIDLRPAVEMLGLGTVLEQVGIDRVFDARRLLGNIKTRTKHGL